METILVMAAIMLMITGFLSLIYKPDLSRWLNLKDIVQRRFRNYEGQNKEEIQKIVNEISHWCETLAARQSYFLMKSNSIIARRIAYLHTELIRLDFFNEDQIDAARNLNNFLVRKVGK